MENVFDLLADFLNMCIDGLVEGVNGLFGILPDSPFTALISSIRGSLGSDILGYINYFLPVSEMLSLLSVWVTAITLYYVVSVILRWARAIS